MSFNKSVALSFDLCVPGLVLTTESGLIPYLDNVSRLKQPLGIICFIRFMMIYPNNMYFNTINYNNTISF